MFKYDFICISETYLDLTISSDNNNISGYNLIRTDHPSNSKGGGVCIYYKESLAVQSLNKIGFTRASSLQRLLRQKNRLHIDVVTYRSPSQTYLEFKKFLTNFDTLLQKLKNPNPNFTMILGDFNARS